MTAALYDAFLSYASADVAFAAEAARRLTAAGFKVWFDKARLEPGCDWHKEIEAGCEASRVVLPVLTPRWKLSEWTKFETYGAEAVIPLIAEGGFNDIFTPPLTRFQGQAIPLAPADDAAWERLIAALRGLLAKTAPDKTARLADVRYQANPYFVGRELELLQIHEAFHENPTAVLTQGRVRAIAALGGVGKTTLARQYVEKFWRCYPQIFWVDCRLGIESEFARLCEYLAPEQADSTDIPAKGALALRLLQSRDERLLVIDNADDEVSVQAWIPKTGHCRTLITSRYSGWSAAVKSIHLYVLEPGPARELLASRAGRGAYSSLSADEQASCAQLAEKLGFLPLALEQAAAYIGQQGTGFLFADYLRLYAEAAAELLAEGSLGSTEYPDSVMTTWKATTRKLCPAARAILRLVSFLSPAPLPISVLISGAETIREEAAVVAGEPLSDVGHAETWVRRQIKELRDYSMVEATGQAISVHPLVLTVGRLQLNRGTGEYLATLKRSLAWIRGAFQGAPGDVRAWPTLVPLASHALEVGGIADKEKITEPTGRLLNQLALLFHAQAQFGKAEPLMRRTLAISETSFGPDHPEVALRLINLASLFEGTNRPAEAEPLFRRALTITENSFGPEHPNVAYLLNNLAQMLAATNRLAEAEPLMRRALDINEKSHGPDHPEVAIRLNNLAALLRTTNRLAEAEPLMERAVSIFEKSLGENHPYVASALNNLAQMLKATNRLAEAEPLMCRALAIDENAYGSEHPKVAICLNNLAQLLQGTNRLGEAETLMRRALAIDEKSYGPNHPRVAGDLNNLAQLLKDTNRLAEAEPLMRRALSIFRQSLGESHPHTQAVLRNLELLKS